MKTAKELAEYSKFTSLHFNSFEFTPDEFKQFCKQLLKEQRESCVKEFSKYGHMPESIVNIRNAPEPEF